MSKARYHPHIDGLRTVAVSLVFVNHVSQSALPSGFVGVDVFFVISGFVVTASILSGGHGSDMSGMFEFWRRRILRIYPALVLFTLVTSLAFANFFALTTPVQFQGVLRTGLAALAGIGNLYLIKSSTDYFLADQSINLFLHTWSLGVEEQFYFLFAPLVFLMPRLIGRSLNSTAILLSVLGAVSLSLFVSHATDNPTVTYYGLHARFWELAIGSLMAFWIAKNDGTAHPILATVAGLVGAMAILLAATMPSTGGFLWPVLVTVLGAAMVIVAGATGGRAVPKLLAHPVMVHLGRLSYGIYLWHFPVLLFVRWNIGFSTFGLLAAILTTLMLASLSFHFLELPIRRSKARFGTRVLPAFMLIVTMAGGTLVLLHQTQGAVYAGEPWRQDDWLPAFNKPYTKNGTLSSNDCVLSGGSVLPEGVPSACRTNPSATPEARKVLLVGDSHAFSQFAMLAAIDEGGSGLTGLALVHDGCAWFQPDADRGTSCAAYQTHVPQLIRQTLSRGDYVLLVSYFPLKDFNEANFVGRLRAVNETATEVGARLIIELPHIRSRTPATLCTSEWFRTNYEGCNVPIEQMKQDRAAIVDSLTRFALAQSNPPILWDPIDDLCSDGTCAAVRDEGPVLRDRNHLAVSASRGLAGSLLKSLVAP